MNASPISAGRLRIGFAVAATLFASACAAGQQAQTAHQRPSIDGADVTVRGMALRGLAIDAPTGAAYTSGASAKVTLVMVNNGLSTDQLTAITSTSFTGWSSAPVLVAGGGSVSPVAASSPAASPSKPVPIEAGNRVSFGTPDAHDVLTISGISKTLYPGSSVTMTFTFAKAGSVTATVPVALATARAGATVPAQPSTGGEG